MVHIPEHYFLRWYFPSGHYLNWNPNDATVSWTIESMECYSHLRDYLIKNPAGLYPEEMTTNDIYFNYLTLIANTYFLSDEYRNVRKAKQLYERLLKSSFENTDVFNNYVWIHLMYPEFDATLESEKLHSYIDKAIHLEKNLNFYDAKACLYALEGNFRVAVNTEEMALTCTYDPFKKKEKAGQHLRLFRQAQMCREIH